MQTPFLYAVAIAAVVILVLSVPVWLLWNGCLVPAVPGLQEVSWAQALGIMVLCNILVKGASAKVGE